MQYFFCEKRIHYQFQIRGDKTQTTRFLKSKVELVDFRMKWIVLPFSETYPE